MTAKNGRQEPYPVWHFKNIKERGVWGGVVRASAPLGKPSALYPGRCSKRGRVGRGLASSGHLGEAKWDKTPFNKSSLSQIIQRICLTPQICQHQLRLGIPLASQFPN